jgi:hypothetical protein
VLHAFLRKSKPWIGLPKPNAESIEMRLQRARELDAEETPLTCEGFPMDDDMSIASLSPISKPSIPAFIK